MRADVAEETPRAEARSPPELDRELVLRSHSSYEQRSGSHKPDEGDSSELELGEPNERKGTMDDTHVKSAAAHGRECAARPTSIVRATLHTLRPSVALVCRFSRG